MIAPVPAIAVETSLSADMGEMIAELNDLLLTLSPPEACYHMTAEEMSGEATTVFVARIDGKAAACGALHRHADALPRSSACTPDRPIRASAWEAAF